MDRQLHLGNMVSCSGDGDDEIKISIFFSHIHLYVDQVHAIDEYKALENCLNEFDAITTATSSAAATTNEHDLNHKKLVWESVVQNFSSNSSIHYNKQEEEAIFVSHNRDVIRQLIAGFGFRITAVRNQNDSRKTSTSSSSGTRTVLLSSCDPKGVQIIVTSAVAAATGANDDQASSISCYYPYFESKIVMEFYEHHNGRQGIAVLAFEISSSEALQTISKRYQDKHPKLLIADERIVAYDDGTQIFEVYAYYTAAATSHPEEEEEAVADRGTKLRFICFTGVPAKEEDPTSVVLPGLNRIPATFDSSSYPCYNDHWVSNVHCRISFLQILQDTLGFLPKVDFNAGVVAAGEAQIESTVTGNNTDAVAMTLEKVLQDQSQVFLPINNALTSKGHVYAFLDQIGQGIQHVASRVSSLTDFVQRANDFRNITGEGFTFLRIPRSYYGVLSHKMLPADTALTVMQACESADIMNHEGAVDLNLSKDDIATRLRSSLLIKEEERTMKEYLNKEDEILHAILFSRYCNMHSLLRHFNLSEQTYIDIVRNQILVDVQGEDLLFQIFSSKMLHRAPDEEAPFFEFIQRVCGASSCAPIECDEKNATGAITAADNINTKIKPGCGGFGIRNFLTLFLSIEVSKAMNEAQSAKLRGDVLHQTYAEKMVSLFTDQLNESNPTLTDISDCMTSEGRAREAMVMMMTCTSSNQDEKQDNQDTDAEINMWREQMDTFATAKLIGNTKLMECSLKYRTRMKQLRLEYEEQRALQQHH